MALALNDRVQQTGTANTTVSFTLSGAITGYQSFAVIGDTNTTYYTATDTSGNWEVGVGTYSTTGPTLTRTTILSSSNSGSAVTFSGTVNVWVDYPAEKAVSTDTLAYPPAIGGTTPSTGTFTTLTAQTEVLKGTGENFVISSQAIGNANWVNGANITVSLNSAVAPDSTTTATTITNATDTTFNSGNNTRSGSITVLPSTNYTFSVYLKLGTATTCSAVFRDGSTGGTSTVTQTTTGVWTRFSATITTGSSTNAIVLILGGANGTFYAWGAQFELGSTVNTYIPTTTTAIYGTPTLSFSGVAGLGLQSDGSLYVQPAGTGALQAQATTSSAVGGNARGSNAVDWQTSRNGASQIASGSLAVLSGGSVNTASGAVCFVGGGGGQTASGTYSGIVSGQNNTASGTYSFVGNGYSNTATGFYGSLLGGSLNSTTSNSVVTTQSATMNGTTAVTLSASNANIKVGQFITGTSISYPNTYVAAISGTSLTLSQAASGSSTSTLSFYTPHGVVVGGGNNQATGSYSFIGGGGDAGTTSNRNVASGDWSFVGGGIKNTASGNYAFVGSGYNCNASGSHSVVCGGGAYALNTASGVASFIGGGWGNQSTGQGAATVGGNNNTSVAPSSFVAGGAYGTTRTTVGLHVFPACSSPISSNNGVSQAALLILAKETTNATATVLVSDNNAVSGTNQIILSNNSAYTFTGVMIANVTGGGNTSSWEFRGCIKRGAGVGTTALVGTPRIDNIGYDAGASTWAFTLTADTTNGGLAVTVTGQASTTIRWVAKIETTEVTY